MFSYTAALQFAQKTASALDFAYAIADRLYWLDEHYVQPFYSWAAPRLRDVAISGLYWTLIALIEIALWLTDTTLQFMARDAYAITLSAFAQSHAPLEFPALPPAAVPLALPSMLLPMAPNPEAAITDDIVPALALCPSVLPMAFSQFLDDDHSIRGWLAAALPLAIAPFLAEAEAAPVSPAVVPVVPSVTEDAPVVKKTRKPKVTEETAQDKTPRKRSPKTAPTAAAR